MSEGAHVSVFDRPNSYVGRTVTRPNAKRLLAGRGKYIDDLQLPRMLHAAFLRSPHAHAKILSIDVSNAEACAGVRCVATGEDVAAHVKPFVGVLTHLEGLKSAPQRVMPIDRVTWQGEPVAVVVADTRAAAEDAVEHIEVEWEELPVVTDAHEALEPGATVLHPELGDNLAWSRLVDAGDTEAAFAKAAHVVEETYEFGRHTGVTLEPRGLVVDYDPSEEKFTIHASHQSPHNAQSIWAELLSMPETSFHVIANDIGGSFGIKLHTYGDEAVILVVSKLLNRPVKYVADRLESFGTDIHARGHSITVKMGVDEDGKILGMSLDDVTGVGPYSMFPRTSAIEANQILSLTGGPYCPENYRAYGRVVFQNKNMMSQYRAVGHPIATVAGECLADKAAIACGLDPVEFRRRNLLPDDSYPCKLPSGLPLEGLSHQACLEKLVDMMDYDGLRADQEEARKQGVFRGIGLASFIEVTNPSPFFYGVGGARISATDGCTIRLEPSGDVTCAIGVTEQGQGTETVIAQVAATAIGVLIERVKVLTGDTDKSPYGGGTWGSRGAGIGGEATYQAGLALKEQILEVAGAILQKGASDLDIEEGTIVDTAGVRHMTLGELATQVQFRTSEIPDDIQPEFVATRHYRVTGYPFVLTNGAQASYVEVDTETGFVRLLKHFVVEDCGRVINPQLVDEQIRGGVIQGIGGALFEHCIYSDEGQLQNGTMADYLVPMAAEMPDIVVGHVETPTQTSELGAKGAGEAGTGGAPAAIQNAINDALSTFNARVTSQPITPQHILKVLGKV